MPGAPDFDPNECIQILLLERLEWVDTSVYIKSVVVEEIRKRVLKEDHVGGWNTIGIRPDCPLTSLIPPETLDITRHHPLECPEVVITEYIRQTFH